MLSPSLLPRKQDLIILYTYLIFLVHCYPTNSGSRIVVGTIFTQHSWPLTPSRYCQLCNNDRVASGLTSLDVGLLQTTSSSATVSHIQKRKDLNAYIFNRLHLQFIYWNLSNVSRGMPISRLKQICISRLPNRKKNFRPFVWKANGAKQFSSQSITTKT